jgi:D-inositol-3-phosphate glycosyltransferase
VDQEDRPRTHRSGRRSPRTTKGLAAAQRRVASRPMRIALIGGVFGDVMEQYAVSAPEAVLLRFLRALGHDVDHLPLSERPPLGLAADVFHANHFGVATYYLALAAARPLVFTPHSGFLLVEGARTKSRLERALEARVLGAADVVVALSRTEADILSLRYGVARERIAVIPNGLDLERYGPSTPRDDGRVQLLAVGQMIAIKGHKYLLDAIAAVAHRHPSLQLTIISHNQSLRPRYEEQSRALGIRDRIVFEALSSDELVARYRAADIFVQPSLVDCFPITIAEAMACGVPVIATDVGGVAEQVGPGGIVVPAADANALARAIDRLAADPAERAHLGAAGARRAHELLDARIVAARHVELYEHLGSRRTSGHLRDLGAAAAIAAYVRRNAVSRFIPRAVKSS